MNKLIIIYYFIYTIHLIFSKGFCKFRCTYPKVLLPLERALLMYRKLKKLLINLTNFLEY